jgi:hypothetical protein
LAFSIALASSGQLGEMPTKYAPIFFHGRALDQLAELASADRKSPSSLRLKLFAYCAGRALMNEQRARFTRPIVDPVERLRSRLPAIRLQNVPQGLLRAVHRVSIVVVQTIVLQYNFEFH